MEAEVRGAVDAASPPIPAVARRLAGAALAVACASVLVEAALLDPSRVMSARVPLAAALRASLGNALPYLVVAVSTSALAVALGERGLPAPRASWPALVCAGVLAVGAAWSTPAFHAALLRDQVRLEGACARLGGPFAPCLDVAAVPVEDAGGLARVLVPPHAAPHDATVRFVGVRTREAVAPGARVELVAGAERFDVTDELRALPPGGSTVIERVARLGPDVGRVRVRMGEETPAPSIFFDARRAVDVAGMAIVAGDGDRAWRAGPALVGGAVGAPALRVDGEHVPGGHAVVVVSGERWTAHDLGPLRGVRGALELVLGPGTSAGWEVKLVGDDRETRSAALSSFERTEVAGGVRYRLPLERLDFGELSPRAVVGVALAWAGGAGAFSLELLSARVGAAEGGWSGFAIGTLGALDPGAPATSGMLVVGDPPEKNVISPGWVRVLAAALAVVGAVGMRGFGAAVRAVPVRAPFALAAGPVLAAVLDPALRAFAAPRLEHLPLALGAVTIGAVVAVAAGAALPRVRAEAPAGAGWADLKGVLGVAGLGVVAAHVTADASGLPWAGHPVPARLPPLLLHAVASSFDAPLFSLAALAGLARLSPGPRLGAIARRMIPALAVWPLVYLFWRHAKADAFGYAEAWREALARGSTWLDAFVLGGAQYHLFLLPLLLFLVAMRPLFAWAARRPAWGPVLLVAALVGWRLLEARVYGSVESPEARAWALAAARALGYTGYGFFAFSLAASDERARRYQAAVAALVALASGTLLVRSAWTVAEAGTWPAPTWASWMASGLLPAALFTLAATFAGGWPRWLVALGALAPGVYLLHPAVLDLLEILQRGRGWSPTETVVVNYAAVTALSLGAAWGLSRVPRLRPLLLLEEAR
jgi:surface polysaccharide O-acyltransferase-like enzyme